MSYITGDSCSYKWIWEKNPKWHYSKEKCDSSRESLWHKGSTFVKFINITLIKVGMNVVNHEKCSHVNKIEFLTSSFVYTVEKLMCYSILNSVQLCDKCNESKQTNDNYHHHTKVTTKVLENI